MNNIFSLKSDPSEGSIPTEVYGYRPYLLAFSATWASAMYGYDSAFNIGGTLNLPSFKRAFNLADKSNIELASLSSNIVSTFQAGAFFGCIIGFASAERLGRKPVLLGSAVVFTIGVILQTLGQLGPFYGGRAITGLAIGASSTIIPIYIAECSPALIRGRLVGIFEIMLQSALVVGFWVNYGVAINIPNESDAQWRIPVSVQFIPAGLLLLTMPFFYIESPRWLLTKGHTQKGRQVLSYIRHLPEDHEYIEKEIFEIQTSLNYELETSSGSRLYQIKEILAPGVRWHVVMSVLLMLLQNLTGSNALNYYSPTIFRSIGFTGTSVALLATGVYGIIKMVTTLIFMVFIVDRFGRRPALLIGAHGAILATFYLGAYTKLSGSFYQTPPQDAGSKTAIAVIYIYAIFYGFSWNGIPWIFASEVLPNRVRTLGNMCAVCTQWLGQFIVVYSLPYMIETIANGTFLFYGASTVVAFIFAFLFIPETKGVPLEDMDLIFGVDAPLLAIPAQRRYKEMKDAGVNAAIIHRAMDAKTDREVSHIEDAI
ncbi:putative MFS quinate transporter [Rosellinia necatrix]|uniref:Quinate transporter n=1 Tax=Rosellinia necatrix TaxID=77044 RepID=A0A1S7UI13_ROSNE|nr:putative MFS quinate transporter [Rosellinia necatrix]